VHGLGCCTREDGGSQHDHNPTIQNLGFVTHGEGGSDSFDLAFDCGRAEIEIDV
jgi:hypothetical protein